MSKTPGVRITPYVVAAICLATLPRHTFADTPPNAAAGLKLAQQYCARCHQIAPAGKRGWTDAPPFESIANRPASTTETLSATIQKPHMKMLNTGRPVAEANDIAVYIMSLRKQ
jgi:mono/diheme cytochrome c family protein